MVCLLLCLCVRLKFVWCLTYCVMFYGLLLVCVFVVGFACSICLCVSFVIDCVRLSGGFVCARLSHCVCCCLMCLCRLFASCCMMLCVLLLC